MPPAAWPEYLPEPANEPLPTRRAFLAGAAQLAELITGYNRRVEVAIAQHLDPLRLANDCVERLNKEVSFSRHLPSELQLRSIDLETAAATARAALPSLTPLPDDLAKRLERHYKEQRPSLWRRLSS